MLWLCIHCPRLPLEVLYPEDYERNFSINLLAIAIAEQHSVYCCSQSATDAGIHSGMAVATARALYPGLQVSPRDTTREHCTLLNLAQACYQFTPAITLLNENTLLLEIRSSLKLFHGLHKLLERIQEEIALHKLSYTLGLADTPKAAQLMVCHGTQHSTQNDIVQIGGINCIDNESGKINQQVAFDKLLNLTPITHLHCPEGVIKKLSRSGLNTLDKVYRLPMTALGKRYGKNFVIYLQQVNGRLPDPQPYITLPETFDHYLELDDAIINTKHLLLLMQDMLQGLSSYLRGKQMYCRGFTWSLYQYRNYVLDSDISNDISSDKNQNITSIELHLIQAQWDVNHFLHLTRIKVEALQLTAPITGIRLFTHDLHPAEYVHNDLLPVDIDYSNQQADQKLDKHIQTLVDTLSARLGKANLYQLAHHNRHIPEQASLSNALFNKHLKTEVNSRPKIRSESGAKTLLNELRPGWLLSQPSPIKNRQQSLYWQGRLTLLRGPERIEGDWWRTAVSRDYYLALHQDNTLYWVYRDRYTHKWFVHGIFG